MADSASSMNWNDLTSRQLPTLSSDGGAAPIQYNRNLSQLHVAGQSLLQGADRQYGQQRQQAFASTPWSIAAAADTQRQHQQQQQPVPQPQQQHRVFENLEDALRRHEQEIFESIVSRTQDDIRASTDARIETQLQKAWDAERALWAKELVGTRWLGGAAASASTTTANTVPLLGHGSSQPSLFVPSRAYDEDRSFHRTTDTSQLDLLLVQAHLNVVKQLSKDDSRSLQETIERFSLLFTDYSDNRGEPVLGYASAWELTQKLVEFVAHSTSLSSPALQQAKATLSHYCRQFQMYVNSTVRQAALAGQDISSDRSYQNDLAAQCEVFAKIKLGLWMTTDPAWAVVYYCLRCGDALAAAEALTTTTDPDPAAERCLAAMAQAQSGCSGIWDSSRALRMDPADRRTVSDLLESAKRVESPNIHQIGVYTLLSGSATNEPVTSDTVEGFKAIEDYLTGALWTAVLQPDPVDELIRLGEQIQNFGPTSFQDRASGGWSFALPLLATQQYQKALTWLAEADGKMGLLQATHIGLVLSSAGIVVRNLGANDSFAATADGLVASLLVAYANELLSIPSAGSLAALEYLVRIPNEIRARKEVAKLIANTGEIEQLVGTLNTVGMREGGAIADRYSGPELASILVEAADILSASKGDQRKTGHAVKCLMLAERYGDVLSLFNELLSPPNERDKDRKFWLDQVNDFHSNYLSKRTHVLEVLEREGKAALIRTSRMLVDLNLFFDCYGHGGSEEECWRVAERLQLLPTSASDRDAKESEYRGMDPLIKESFPAFLVAVMGILRKEHSRLKRNLHGDSSGVVRERLKELQEKAHLYAAFAASVGMANDQMGKLTELVSLMI